MPELQSPQTQSLTNHKEREENDFDEIWEKLHWRKSSSETETNSCHKMSTPSKSKASRKSPRRSPRSQHRQRSHKKDTPEKENLIESDSNKSFGISSKTFYSKPPSDVISPISSHLEHRYAQQAEELKETIENNVLAQQKLSHKASLEHRRKAFRRFTTLKTWPLQDLAMEHFMHLTDHSEPQSSSSQFHGGDYLSSESMSSTGSESAQVKRRQKSSPRPKQLEPIDDGVHSQYDNVNASLSLVPEEPLWCRQPRIFAIEKAQGKRKYLVGHFGRIADWYWRKCTNKHLYEVITQDTPCRLYFDLEYSKVFNDNIDDNMLLNEFRQELASDLKNFYNVDLDASKIIDLDSTTDKKFSRHWIIDLDENGLFEDAPTVGRFVKRLVGRLAEEVATNQLQTRCPTLSQHLFVKTKDPNKSSCFIDLGVYTRNRLFRCYASSKFGKSNALHVASDNSYPLEELPTLFTDYSKNDDNAPQPLSPTSATSLEDYIAANNWEPHARVLAATLVVPLGQRNKANHIFRVEQSENKGYNANGKSKTQPAIHFRYVSTPFPALDQYVLKVLACRGGTKGDIRAWSMGYGGPRGDVASSITYQLSRNRYCELIGRAHKSNNIFWTIIFDTWTCIQGCHDPECFGRGSPVAIRQEFLPEIQAEFEEWQDAEFEKALLALNLDDITTKNDTGPAPSENQLPSSISVVTATDRTTSCSEEHHGNKETNDNQDDSDLNSSLLLSDEALLLAIESNPTLFP